MVNNAGVLRDRMIFTMSPQEWDLVIRVHLRGHFVTTRLATAWWRAASKQAGGPVYARIINTCSEARVRTVFRASGTADGMWTPESVHAALGHAFPPADPAGSVPPAGFACEDTLALATETIGFPGRGAKSR